MNDPIVLIMAGGLGKRMNSNIPKVLHKLHDKPMLIHVIETSIQLNPVKIGLIVGKYRNQIEETIQFYLPHVSNITFIDQIVPQGTGHAIKCCIPFLSDYINHNCIILSGDAPLIQCSTLKRMLNKLSSSVILATQKENPYGYGRIVMGEKGFQKIIEENDATSAEKTIKLINGGIYAFNISLLVQYLPFINNHNSQNEYYLTDIFQYLSNDLKIIDICELSSDRAFELLGANTPEQLKQLELYHFSY